MRANPRSCRVRGFTLIELMVAVSLLAIMAGLGWRAVDAMLRSRDLTQAHGEALQRLQAGVGQWRADLDATVETGELSPLLYDGQVLRLVRQVPGSAPGAPAELQVVAWALRDAAPAAGAGTPGGRAWMRWQSPTLRERRSLAEAWQRAVDWGRGAASVQPGDSALAVVAAQQWELFYHRGETWSNPLSATGAESGPPGSPSQPGQPVSTTLPNAVRLVLVLPAGDGPTGRLQVDWLRPAVHPGAGS